MLVLDEEVAVVVGDVEVNVVASGSVEVAGAMVSVLDPRTDVVVSSWAEEVPPSSILTSAHALKCSCLPQPTAPVPS